MNRIRLGLLTRKTLSSGARVVGVPKFNDAGELLVEGGPQGATGPQGPAGANGANGADGLGLLDYSTAEQNTGVKWIDGKDIFQRTFTGTTGTGLTKVVAWGLATAALSDLVGLEGIMKNPNAGNPRWFTIPTIDLFTIGNQLHVRLQNNAGTLEWQIEHNAAVYDNTPVLWTAYYTKV